jgi:hypothetical protein
MKRPAGSMRELLETFALAIVTIAATSLVMTTPPVDGEQRSAGHHQNKALEH